MPVHDCNRKLTKAGAVVKRASVQRLTERAPLRFPDYFEQENAFRHCNLPIPPLPFATK
jgi:hypothetical protein